MLIYKIILSLLIYIFYGRGRMQTDRSTERQTNKQTNKQTDRRSLDLRQELANKQTISVSYAKELANRQTKSWSYAKNWRMANKQTE